MKKKTKKDTSNKNIKNYGNIRIFRLMHQTFKLNKKIQFF